ncbi:hypothetical protein MN116_005927 [Schistosoma mekongi]|uniref:Uncharacterized protein n=1 Tax=Schistosoma mekongi TaxID=38744 RepID=A0AAE2D507_SCHME|nr:hypothetical protein MN116_005927 [Schistosoma mekongi]
MSQPVDNQLVTFVKLSDKNLNAAKFSESVNNQNVLDFGDVNAMVVRTSSDDKYWIIGLSNGTIVLLSTEETDKQTNNFYTLKADGENFPCSDLQPIPSLSDQMQDNHHLLLAVYVSGHARLWHYTGAMKSSRLLTTFTEERISNPSDPPLRINTEKFMNQILSCSCSYDGKRFITGGDDCHLRVYDIKSRKCLRICSSSFTKEKMDGHVMRICAVKYHPRGAVYQDYVHIFITGGWDDTIQIWDDRYLHSLWIYYGPHICGSDALEIESESNHILSSSWRRDKSILQVWKFNEELMIEFYNSAEHQGDELSIPSGVEIINKQTGASHYCKPLAEIAQDTYDGPSKGYVAKWLGSYYIAFGGSDSNILKLISRFTLNVVGSVTELTSGVYSLAYIQPKTNDNNSNKRIVQFAFASGTRVYIAQYEQK